MNEEPPSTPTGDPLLAARELIERRVRFIGLIDTGSSGHWNAHVDMLTHEPLGKHVDQPIAAQLRDYRLTDEEDHVVKGVLA